MSRSKRPPVIRTAVLSAAARALSSCFSLGYLIWLGRTLPQATFGAFAVIESLRMFLANLPGGAVGQALIKSSVANQRPVNSILVSALGYAALLLVILVGTTLPVLAFPSSVVWSSLPIPETTLFTSSVLLYVWARSALLAGHHFALLVVTEGIILLTLGASYALWSMGGSPPVELPGALRTLSTAYAAGLLPAVWLFVQSRREASPAYLPAEVSREELAGEARFQGRFLVFALPNSYSASAFSVLDAPVVMMLLGPVAAGVYKAARLLVNLYSVLADAAHIAFFPSVSAYGIDRIGEAFRLYLRYASLACGSALVVSVAVFAGSDQLLEVLYAGQYLSSDFGLLLSLFALWGPIFVLARLLGSLVAGLGEPRLVLIPSLASAGVAITLMVVLVPLLGLDAVGVAAISSSAILAAGLVLNLRIAAKQARGEA